MDEQVDEPLVEREVELPLDAEEAWRAISESEGLSEWLAEEVQLEPVEGSPARFVVEGEERHGQVREVVDGRRISFTWRAPEQPATLVELDLEPIDRELTRLQVRETAPAGVRCAATVSMRRTPGGAAGFHQPAPA